MPPLIFTLLFLLYLLLFYVQSWPEEVVVIESVGEQCRERTWLIPVEFYSLITVCCGKTERIRGS